MSIASAIVAAQEKVESAYTVVSNKGGTIPATKNLNNLPTAITSIPSSGGSAVIEPLLITPSTSSQTIEAPEGVDGFSPVNVDPVDATIDTNIVAENIKDGVEILGVVGTCPYIPVTISSLNITPTTSAQYITPPAGSIIDGYSPIEVSAVDNTIDANIVAGNIKSGVSILGVTGTYSGDVSGVYREFEIDNGELRSNRTTSHVIDFTGITRIYSYQLAAAYTDNTVVSGNIDMSDITRLEDFSCIWMFARCTAITGIDLSALPAIDSERSCEYMFEGCSALITANISSLVTVTAQYGAAHMFEYTGLTSLSLPALTTISGAYGCAYMCSNCFDLISASLPLLSDITGVRACYFMFAGCSALTSLSFPAITTTSFGTRTNQFDSMCSAIPNITLHFPSNVQSVIEGLDGYSATAPFGAVSGTVLFDLPATS